MPTAPPTHEPLTRPRRVRLLPRVRTLFRRLAWLTLLVQVIEWVDATSPLVPNRLVAAAGLVAALAWTFALKARPSAPWWCDVGIAATLTLTSWGLGRPGAVLTMLLGVTFLRVVHGSRRSSIAGTGALIGGYAGAVVVNDGVESLVDLGLVTVAVALFSFAAVIRYLAEVLAQHDVLSAWDEALTHASHEMVVAEQGSELDLIVARTVLEVERVGPRAADGLLPVPNVFTAFDLSGPADPIRTLDAERALGRELIERLERLRNDGRMIRDRIDSDARYRLLADRSRDGIYLRQVDEPDRLLYVNTAATELYPGLGSVAGSSAAVGMEMVHPDDHASIEEQIGAVGYLAEPVRMRLPLPDDDTERWVEVQEVLTTTEDGTGIVQGTVRDISRQQRHEEAMEAALAGEREASERLREVDELRATFLAAVSHELRTPMAALLGSSLTLAQHRDRLTQDQSDRLADAVRRQGDRLTSLLDDLLDVERLSQGLIVPDRTPTALQALVAEVVAEHREQYAHIAVAPTSTEVVLDVDASQVERIVDNLVRNARKHTPEGTTIALSVAPIEGGARIVVEDDGPGIPVSLRGTLFEPFEQGPSAARSASPGTGIGLSLVRRFAELHGGRAWIEESATGGARFTVELLGAEACDVAEGVGGLHRDGLVGRP